MSIVSKEQMESIKCWIKEGLSIGDIQNRLREVYGLHFTYMETRLALADANLSPKSAPEKQKKTEEPISESTSDKTKSAEGIVNGEVSVTVDPLTRPGALVNGNVVFSDGQKAFWQLDNMGRLSLKPDTPGYRPNSEDLMQFQKEIQSQLEGL